MPHCGTQAKFANGRNMAAVIMMLWQRPSGLQVQCLLNLTDQKTMQARGSETCSSEIVAVKQQLHQILSSAPTSLHAVLIVAFASVVSISRVRLRVKDLRMLKNYNTPNGEKAPTFRDMFRSFRTPEPIRTSDLYKVHSVISVR
jgi:hypothetical protein